MCISNTQKHKNKHVYVSVTHKQRKKIEYYGNRCLLSSSSLPSQQLNMHKKQPEHALLTGSYFLLFYYRDRV